MGLHTSAHLLGNKEELAAIAQKLFDPVSRAALAGAVMLGDGLLQLFLMLFVIFFFYRDGEVLSQKSLALLTRMSGSTVPKFATLSSTQPAASSSALSEVLPAKASLP